MTVDGFLQAITQFVFVLITLLTVVDYLRNRDPQRRDAALMFASLGLGIAIGVLLDGLGLELSWARTGAGILVLAHPFLLLRLVVHFRRVPRWISALAGLGFAASAVIIAVVPPPLPPVPNLVILGTSG